MAPVSADGRILDLAHLQRQTFGDRSLEREVLALFEQQCASLMPLILDSDDPTQRGGAAHRLDGAARAVGAWRVAALCGRLETALDEGRPGETLARLGAELDRAIGEARDALAERMADRHPSPSP